MQEYDRLDAEYYDFYSTGLEGDVAFYVEEAKKAGSPVLEIGCGTGRITLPVALAGVQTTGLDLAPAMLSVFKRKLEALDAETQARVTVVEADMRDFSLDERFQLVMIPYRAFSYMYTPEDQRQALENIHAHLVEGGRLILNVFDPRLDVITRSLGMPTLLMDSEFVHPTSGHRVVVWDSRQYNPELQLVEQYFIFEELDDDGAVLAKRYVPLRLRYFYRYEMQHLLELAGFRVEALYGDFYRRAFHYGGEQIWIAQKV